MRQTDELVKLKNIDELLTLKRKCEDELRLILDDLSNNTGISFDVDISKYDTYMIGHRNPDRCIQKHQVNITFNL